MQESNLERNDLRTGW